MIVKKIFIIFCILFLISSCTNNTDEINILNIGYCPTMKPYVDNLIILNNELNIFDDINFINFGSSAEVLSQLNQNNIDLAIVGRIALKNELIEKNEIKLKKSYTLISKEKAFIDYSILDTLEIHTYLAQDITNIYFPKNKNIIYYNSLEEIPKNNIIFIDWDDFYDDMQLLIPMINNQKVIDFRIPVIYYNNEKHTHINQLINFYLKN
jgi:hypothetical protein